MKLPLAVLVILVSGCTIRPSQRTMEPQDGVVFPADPNRPARPATRPPERPVDRPALPERFVDQICRTAPVPHGWLVTRYTDSAGRCVRTRGEHDYSVAVIERYLERPIDFRMTICADQRVPGNWTVEQTADVCPGAAVREGQPTSFTIRRVH